MKVKLLCVPKTGYICRKRGEGYRSRPDLVPSTQDRKYQVVIWGCICWYDVGILTCITGNINSEKYKTILEDNIWTVIAKHFPENNIFPMMIMLQSIDPGCFKNTRLKTI